MTDPAFDVFLCHRSGDKPAVEEIGRAPPGGARPATAQRATKSSPVIGVLAVATREKRWAVAGLAPPGGARPISCTAG